MEAFKGQPLNWFEAISKYQNNLAPSEDSPVVCFYGSDNDKIGNVIKFYESPGFGAGAHSVKSDTGDYTLRYTIIVKPPPFFGMNQHFDSNAFLNQTQQNNTVASNKIE